MAKTAAAVERFHPNAGPYREAQEPRVIVARIPAYTCRGCLRRLPPRNADGVELFYHPADLDPCAPRLRIRKRNGRWELWDADEVLLGSYPLLPDALDAGLARSAMRYSEILVLASNGAFEWSVHHNPEMEELARILNQAPTREREREAAD